MLISSENTLPDTLRNNVWRLSGHPEVQSSWHTELAILEAAAKLSMGPAEWVVGLPCYILKSPTNSYGAADSSGHQAEVFLLKLCNEFSGSLPYSCCFILKLFPLFSASSPPRLPGSGTFSFWDSSTFSQTFLEVSLHLSGVRVEVVCSKYRKEMLIFEDKWILSFVVFPLHFYILSMAEIMSFVIQSLVSIWYVSVLNIRSWM